MKKIQFLCLLLITSTISFSQDFEPSHCSFTWSRNPLEERYLSSDMDYFNQNKFLLGWQWGGSKKMKRALNMNASAEGYACHNADIGA
jgi:hypothetical protein